MASLGGQQGRRREEVTPNGAPSLWPPPCQLAGRVVRLRCSLYPMLSRMLFCCFLRDVCKPSNAWTERPRAARQVFGAEHVKCIEFVFACVCHTL